MINNWSFLASNDDKTVGYYLNSRHYNPEIGRFINADGQINNGILGSNMYAYALNNPVMMVDPSGNSPIGVVFAAIFGIAGQAGILVIMLYR